MEHRSLGDEYPSLPTTLSFLAGTVAAQGRLEDAQDLARKAVEVARRILPEGHWRLAHAESVLGECLLDQGHLDEAEPLLRNASANLESSLGAGSIYSRDATTRLEQFELASSGAVPISTAAPRTAENPIP